MSLRKEIEDFLPFDEQEEKDKEQILKYIDSFDDVLTRDNTIGHFSSSAFVVNKERTKMLVVYHNIYDAWIYPGGHVDGEKNLLSVAVREVEEETGLKISPLNNSIFAVQTLPVKDHIKRGKPISAHTHLDVVYVMEANDKLPLVYREDESKGVKWIPFENASDETMCDFIRPVHKKLIKKLESGNY